MYVCMHVQVIYISTPQVVLSLGSINATLVPSRSTGRHVSYRMNSTRAEPETEDEHASTEYQLIFVARGDGPLHDLQLHPPWSPNGVL